MSARKQPRYLTQIRCLTSGGLIWETQSDWPTKSQANDAARIHREFGDTVQVIEEPDASLVPAKGAR